MRQKNVNETAHKRVEKNGKGIKKKIIDMRMWSNKNYE